MTPPTDLRAALRDAANALARIGLHRDADLIASLRAIADAPPTVAELLPMVDATHRVVQRFDQHRRSRVIGVRGVGEIEEAWADDAELESGAPFRWQALSLTVADLTAPARLVEVSP